MKIAKLGTKLQDNTELLILAETQAANDAGSRGVTFPMVTELCEEIESF